MYDKIAIVKDVALEIENLNFKFPYDAEKWVFDLGMNVENYHKHTVWSNMMQMDSATFVPDFMDELRNQKCQLFFSGEHGFQGEWLYIYDVCKAQNRENPKENLKFRYSTECYWVKNRAEADNTNCHMVIVARTYEGIRKLNYILSIANVEGYYYKPRIDIELLFLLNKDDVYVTSACVAGWKYDDADEIWKQIGEHFGDSFFLEYQAHNTPAQKELNQRIFEMSRKYGFQTIIGLDTHYLSEEDCRKRNNLLKRKGITYDDEEGWYIDFPSGETLFERMIEQGVLTVSEILKAMMNTHVFVDGCEETEIPTHFKIPILPQLQHLSYKERVQAEKRLLWKRYKNEPEEYKSDERINGIGYEVTEVAESGTIDYFLTNDAIIKLAKTEEFGGKLTTTSRGSAASFYISKLHGFTTMDRFDCEVPIYPERFLTKDRILGSHQCPDIDYNIEKQEPFVRASRHYLGEHGCYPLLAVGELGEKSGFKLYASVKGVEPAIANAISKDIDRYNDAVKYAEDDFKDEIQASSFISDPAHLRIFNDSKPYQGIIEQRKCHACGHLIFNGDTQNPDVIGYGDIRYEIGLIRCVSESTGKNVIVACVEGDLLDKYGFVKNDYLIVDVVGITNKLYQSIGMSVPTVLELRKMVENDLLTWDLYAKGITCCLNQCEKSGTTRRVMQYQPKTIKELAAFIAAIRPGFKSLLDGFLSRISYTSGEPAIDELLQDCFHYMLYQEAIMKIFSYLGISMKDSYDTIKKISKKKLKGKALEDLEVTLKDHWQQNIGNLDQFEPVYHVIKDSARYSFNAPHALAMANDSLYEAWMKAHHTSRFYEVTLNHYQEKSDKDKVADLIREATDKFGYTLGAYQYGKPNSKFTIDDEQKIIHPNLASIKGIGEKVVDDMTEIAKTGVADIIGVYLATKGTSVNKTVFKNLIKIGYFPTFGSVKKLLQVVDVIEDFRTSGNNWYKNIKKESPYYARISQRAKEMFLDDKNTKGIVNETSAKILDPVAIVRDICSAISNDEYSTVDLAKFQYEILGYVDIVDSSLDPKYAIVTNLDLKYSPKFEAYSLARGKVAQLKVHKKKNYFNKDIVTSFNDVPFQDGDVLYLKKSKQQAKSVKNGDVFVPDPSVLEWWVKDYFLVR